MDKLLVDALSGRGYDHFVDLCNITRLTELKNLTEPLHPMTWRFMPLIDPTVDRYVSRDSDSTILDREVDAVREWLYESNATFHIMRDHKMHLAHILGGMWGAKINQRREEINAAAWPIYHTFKHQHNEYAFDQDCLYEFIWPLAINDMVSTIKLYCQILLRY